jgi:hypothetical protein
MGCPPPVELRRFLVDVDAENAIKGGNSANATIVKKY